MKQKLMNLVYIVIGNILIAFAVSTLLFENDIIAGGVSGIGSVLHHYFGLNVSLSVGMINVALFVLGLVFIGKMFAMTTLVSTFLFPLALQFFEGCAFFHGYLNDPFLSCILSGWCWDWIGLKSECFYWWC